MESWSDTEKCRAGFSRPAEAGPHMENEMETLVQIEKVRKVYKRDEFEVPVLNGITLDVPGGDFLALMGPSGSGKTTLLNLIAGIDRPTSGRILVEEKEISRFSETALASWRARHVGFIFQLYNLIPVLNAFENVELPLLLTKLSKKQRREHVTPPSTSSASATACFTTRVNSLAARSSVWPSRARSSPIRCCSSPTSRPAISMPATPKRS